jgi:hypothetical protein
MSLPLNYHYLLQYNGACCVIILIMEIVKYFNSELSNPFSWNKQYFGKFCKCLAIGVILVWTLVLKNIIVGCDPEQY